MEVLTTETDCDRTGSDAGSTARVEIVVTTREPEEAAASRPRGTESESERFRHAGGAGFSTPGAATVNAAKGKRDCMSSEMTRGELGGPTPLSHGNRQ